jgi:hypothetical protein
MYASRFNSGVFVKVSHVTFENVRAFAGWGFPDIHLCEWVNSRLGLPTQPLPKEKAQVFMYSTRVIVIRS